MLTSIIQPLLDTIAYTNSSLPSNDPISLQIDYSQSKLGIFLHCKLKMLGQSAVVLFGFKNHIEFFNKIDFNIKF